MFTFGQALTHIGHCNDCAYDPSIKDRLARYDEETVEMHAVSLRNEVIYLVTVNHAVINAFELSRYMNA